MPLVERTPASFPLAPNRHDELNIDYLTDDNKYSLGDESGIIIDFKLT